MMNRPGDKKLEEKTVKLQSQEGEIFAVSETVAKLSVVIKNLIEEDQDEEDDEEKEIPLPNVKTPILAKVIDFCQHYCQEQMHEIEKVPEFLFPIADSLLLLTAVEIFEHVRSCSRMVRILC